MTDQETIIDFGDIMIRASTIISVGRSYTDTMLVHMVDVGGKIDTGMQYDKAKKLLTSVVPTAKYDED